MARWNTAPVGVTLCLALGLLVLGSRAHATCSPGPRWTIPGYAARIAVGDVDGDGMDDIIAVDPNFAGHNGRLWLYSGAHLDDSDFGLRLELGGATQEGFGTEVEYLGDWDGDNMNEFAVGVRPVGTVNGEVRIYQCAESLDELHHCVVTTTGSYILALEGTISGNAGDPGTFYDIGFPHWIASGDIDGDGLNEIVVGAKGNFYGTGTTAFAVWDPDDLSGPQYGPVHACGRNISSSFGTADVDGDGAEEVVITEYASGVDAGLIEYWKPGSGIFHHVADRLGPDLDLVIFGTRATGIGQVDVGAQGSPDLRNVVLTAGNYIGNGAPGRFWLLDGVDTMSGLGPPLECPDFPVDTIDFPIYPPGGEVLAFYQETSPWTRSGLGDSLLDLGDVDGDGSPEFAAGGLAGITGSPSSRLTVFDYATAMTGAPKFEWDLAEQLLDIATGDVNDDGTRELVAAWFSGIRIYGLAVTDGDSDGESCATDCNDADADVYSGALELCDGIAQDCAGSNYPSAPADEADTDADGYRICEGDCDDTNAAMFPGNPEICDGLDNDCNFVVDDNTDPGLMTQLDVAQTSPSVADLSWPAVSGDSVYDVVMGHLGVLAAGAGDFTAATDACLADDLAGTGVSDLTLPDPGDGIWYLVRVVNACGASGTYDASGVAAPRDAGITGSGAPCP